MLRTKACVELPFNVLREDVVEKLTQGRMMKVGYTIVEMLLFDRSTNFWNRSPVITGCFRTYIYQR